MELKNKVILWNIIISLFFAVIICFNIYSNLLDSDYFPIWFVVFIIVSQFIPNIFMRLLFRKMKSQLESDEYYKYVLAFIKSSTLIRMNLRWREEKWLKSETATTLNLDEFNVFRDELYKINTMPIWSLIIGTTILVLPLLIVGFIYSDKANIFSHFFFLYISSFIYIVFILEQAYIMRFDNKIELMIKE